MSIAGPSLKVENLNLYLGNSHILTDVNFEIASGSIHCFIGPNGGGKTSTIRCLLGQMPHKGNIHINWHSEDTQHTIGYVPQLIEMERTLPLTIENFLAIVSQDKPAFTGLKKTLKPQIITVLEKVGLADKQKFMLGSLSGGERQRLLFAQALLPSPSLLVLDEPMTSMDEGGVHTFEALVEELHQQGITILWVNHDLSQVAKMADSISVIDHGLLAHGATSETLTNEMQQGIFRKHSQASTTIEETI